MLCPFCSSEETKVTDKRDSKDETRRRRECLSCGKRFTTYERIEPVEIFVIKKDWRREPFNREKLKAGFIRACEKRPVTGEQIEHSIIFIEEKLKQQGNEVSSKMIGELVMKQLKKLDKVAYIRFASVYKDFKEIEDFTEAIKEVEK